MTRVRRSRGLLWLLLAATLFMRAVVPQGYMAEPGAVGAISVKVCGSGHVVQIPLGEDDAPVADDRAQPCIFAGLGTAALPPAAFAALPVPAAGEAAHAVPVAAAPRLTGPRTRPPARGPPLAA